MFGHVLLGGCRLRAFFWETESPEWYECVVLYSPKAVEHQVVSLHFRVLAERAFLNEEVEREMTIEDDEIVEECRLKLSQSLRVPRKVQFTRVDFVDESFSEVIMAMEVEEMMNEYSDEEYLMSSSEEAERFDDGYFYTAEIFGDRFVDDVHEDRQERNTGSLRHHMVRSLINDVDSQLLPAIDGGNLSNLSYCSVHNPVLGTPHNGELKFWEMNIEEGSDDEDLLEDHFLPFEDIRTESTLALEPAPAVSTHRRAVSEPILSSFTGNDNGSELERKPAFISTKGKEQEIWKTYREEITSTWRMELEQMQRELEQERTAVE